MVLLTRARVVLSPRGAWYKNGYKGGGGARCLRQALDDSDGVLVPEAEKFVLRAVKELYPGKSSTNIPNFNDATGIHKHDVIRVLDRALELAQGGTNVSH